MDGGSFPQSLPRVYAPGTQPFLNTKHNTHLYKKRQVYLEDVAIRSQIHTYSFVLSLYTNNIQLNIDEE